MYFPKVRKPRPILFDLGDTLINFSATNPLPYLPEGTKLAYEFMADQGVKLPSFHTYLRNCRHSTYIAYALAELRRREVDLLTTMRKMHRSLRLPHDDTFLLALAERFYDPIKILGSVEENIHEVLDHFVEQQHPMGIVSNTMVPGKLLDAHLEEEGLLKYFPVRIYSCDTGVKKPHGRMFRSALRSLNARPQDTVFVGDKIHLDVKGAKRQGMMTVLKVRKGPVPNGRYTPDYVVRHLTELPDLITKLGSQYYDSTINTP